MEPTSRTFAVLGTGLMGAGIARSLARNGFAVRAWNRSPDKAQTLAPDGIQPFEAAADAVRGADVIVTMLTDGQAAAEVIRAARPGIAAGAVWLQLSTVGVEATETLATLAGDLGLSFYDAPVLGTRQPAEQGKLVILAAGPLDGRDAVQPVLDAIGQRTLWVSETPGVGSRLKLALNAYVFAITHGAAESLAIAQALGVDPALVVKAVTGGPLDSGFFQAKAAAMLAGDYAVSFSVGNAVKDGRLLMDAVDGTGVRLDLAGAGLARFVRAERAGHGDKDMAASFLASGSDHG